jgi:hypothetical protein
LLALYIHKIKEIQLLLSEKTSEADQRRLQLGAEEVSHFNRPALRVKSRKHGIKHGIPYLAGTRGATTQRPGADSSPRCTSRILT